MIYSGFQAAATSAQPCRRRQGLDIAGDIDDRRFAAGYCSIEGRAQLTGLFHSNAERSHGLGDLREVHFENAGAEVDSKRPRAYVLPRTMVHAIRGTSANEQSG